MLNEYDFKNKYALLDVNILSQMFKEKRAEKFRPVFEFLKKNSIAIFLIDATYFEFTSFIADKRRNDLMADWINQFSIHECRFEDIKLASLLSSYYAHADPNLNKKQISYADCLYATQLVKFGGRAFIITTDIHDYPVSVFDISKVEVVEDGQRALVVAFVTYNKEKWQALSDRFNKSKGEI